MEAPAVPGEQMIVEERSSLDQYASHAHAELPTLRKMASCSVALSIWRTYIHLHSKPTYHDYGYNYYYLTDVLGIPNTYKDECDRMVESLQTQTSIEKALKADVEYISNNTKDCILHFHYRNYDHLEGEVALCRIKRFDVNWCVWLPNGDIDYAKTASKVVNCAKLTLAQRFAIMCQFCMEEVIKNFPLHLLSISQLNFKRDYLMIYWICYLKKELDEIPLQNLNSADLLMARTCDFSYWHAFEYFWNRLGVNDQVSLMKYKLDDPYSRIECYQDLIFSKMSRQQLQSLLFQRPVKILLNFWTAMNMPESAMWVWTHTKNVITREGFTSIVLEVFEKSVQSENNDVHHLFEIWYSASEEQRSHAILELGDKLILVLSDATHVNKAALDFMRMYLITNGEDFRKQLILRNRDELAFQLGDPNDIDSIIQLCLPRPADQLEYKRWVMRSTELLARVMDLPADGFLEKLMAKIKYFWTDEEIAKEFVTRLLVSEHIGSRFVNDVEKWNKLCQFIHKIFPQDVTFGLDLKKQIITEFARVGTPDCNIWTDHRLDQMDKILATVFTYDEELQLVKKSLLDSFRRRALSGASYWPLFDETYFVRFVSWCLNGEEEAVAEFIRNAPVSEVFDAYFNRIEGSYANSQVHIAWNLKELNLCLRYFKGVEGARQYKIEKIKDFEKNRLFPGIFQRGNESCLDTIFRWAFDDNEEDVRKFKSERVVFMEA